MQRYGTVAGTSRDYVEFKGRRIENERRKVLFTVLFEHMSVPKEMKLFGTTIYAKCRGQDVCGICRDNCNGHKSLLQKSDSGSSLKQGDGRIPEMEGGKVTANPIHRYTTKEKRASALDSLNKSAGIERDWVLGL